VRMELGAIAYHRNALKQAHDDVLAEIRIQGAPGNGDNRAANLGADWLLLGQIYGSMHRPWDSVLAYDRAIQFDARNPGAWSLLGKAYDAVHQIRSAGSAYSQAIRLDPKNEMNYIALGLDQQVNGRPLTAIATFTAAIKANPTVSLAYVDRAIVEAMLGRRTVAEQDLRRAIALNPSGPRAHFNLGVVLSSEGKDQAAKDQLRLAATLSKGQPQEATAWARLGIVLDRMADYAGAIQARRRLLALQPGSSQAHIALGLDLLMTGQPRAARAEFASVVRSNPHDSTVYYDLALADDRIGNASGALADLRQQIAVNKSKKPALIVDYRYLGTVYGSRGRWSDAVVAFRQAMALGGKTYADYFGLGYSLAHAGDKSGAVSHLHQAYSVAKASRSLKQADAACRQLKNLGGAC
jgi:tetratricopeptide (TPR) repeat protein